MRLTTFAGAGISLLSAAALSAALPVAAAAQARPSLDLFLLQNDALAGSGPLYGLGFGTGGTIGLRVSGAVGFGRQQVEFDDIDQSGVTAFGADADLVLSVGDLVGGWGAPRGRTRSGVAPYAFAGLGIVGRRLDGSYGYDGESWERGPSASFGGGVKTFLGDVLGLDASARYRTAVADSSRWVDAFPRGWEYRVGLSLSMGGSPSRARSASRGRTTPRRPSSRETTRGRNGSVIEQMGTILSIPTSTTTSAAAARIVNTADDYLGVPYVWGGDTPRGFDCSGFTKYVFARNGITLPRVSRDQAKVGERVVPSLSALRVGDLLFFAENYSRVDHVAIYIGDDRIIHATSSGGEVRYDDLRSDRGQWFVDHMVSARRFTGSASSWESALAPLVNQLVKEFDRGDRAPRPR
ncbi:MAG TPA: C40 family peptidase [Gemmatimonadaceae bacterium]|nr:C40 family peptidase [Gemmatimonadaceae bacterium]